MQTTTYSNQGFNDRPSPLCIGGVIAGYLVALFGALSVLSVRLYISFLILLAGSFLLMLASRSVRTLPKWTWQAWFVLIAGYVVIFAVLWLFGDERVRQWRPHPVGWILGWWILFHGFHYIRHILSGHGMDPNRVD